MNHPLGKWTRFAIGLALLAGTIGMLHVVGSGLPGQPGALLAQNKAQDREVYAYFYSDLGELSAFLDDLRGAYGATALRRVMKRPSPSP